MDILKKICFNLTFNFLLFFGLVITIQNSGKQSRVNLLVNQSVKLPISFIIGTSFISGSFLGNIISMNYKKNC